MKITTTINGMDVTITEADMSASTHMSIVEMALKAIAALTDQPAKEDTNEPEERVMFDGVALPLRLGDKVLIRGVGSEFSEYYVSAPEDVTVMRGDGAGKAHGPFVEIDRLKKELAEARAKASDFEAAAKSIGNAHGFQRGTISDLQMEIGGLRRDVAAAEEETNRKKDEARSLRDINPRYRDLVSEERKKNVGLHREISRNEATIFQMAAKLGELEKKADGGSFASEIFTKDATIYKLNRKIEELENSKEFLRRERSIRDARITALANKVEELEARTVNVAEGYTVIGGGGSGGKMIVPKEAIRAKEAAPEQQRDEKQAVPAMEPHASHEVKIEIRVTTPEHERHMGLDP